jgi:5-formyltetrahydrofolate cyclo-ligase
MADSAQAKQKLREQARARVAAIEPAHAAARSKALCALLADWDVYRAARTIMIFVAMPGEVDLRPLADRAAAAGKRICLPRADWKNRRLGPVPVAGFDDLVSVKGIMEPPPMVPGISLAQLDLVLVPGLAFDQAGRRLGRGAGFYDRFLSEPGLTATPCGVCFQEQIVPAVPADSWDIPMKAVATDNRLIEVENLSP